MVLTTKEASYIIVLGIVISVLPISSTSINYINIDSIELMIIKFLSEIDIVILRLPCLFSIANVGSSMVVFVNSGTSNSVSSLTLQCALWLGSVSPLSWFHVLKAGEELDDKHYI
jgi:hypothetical protein